MAKVFKATVFFVDSNGKYENKENLMWEIERQFDNTDLVINIEEIQESEEFEWDDDLDINLVDAENIDYDKYLKE